MIKKLKTQLIRHEGLRLKPYRCTSGKLTIGIGRNLDDRGISEREAMQLLENDIAIVTAELCRRITFYNKLHVDAQLVLANMAFNMGFPRLLKFKKTLAYLKTKKYREASVEMLDSRWARQVGSRAVELSEILKTLS